MRVKHRSWWQQINQHRVAISVVATVLVVVIALIITVHWFGWDWTGFTSATGPTLKPNEQYRPAKTLWDVLQLLIVPLILAIGGFWLNQIQKSREEKTAKQRTENEQMIASDNQRATALQAYIDKMSELLLKEHLGELKPEYEEVSKIARVRTLTILPRLDVERKRSVLQFLHESGLIDKGKRIVDLDGADLQDANLREAKLSKADLSGANLRGTELNGADLSEADLREANLEEARLILAKLGSANLREAKLSKADLSGADLSGADLRNADLWNAKLSAGTVIWRYGMKAYSSGVGFPGANLSRANLSGANLREAVLWSADLSRADLSRANLSEAYLSRANLSEADLTEADLSEVDLSGAKQTQDMIIKINEWSHTTSGKYPGAGADLTRAKLRGTDLTRANLSGVDLAGADLTGAIAAQEQLDTAKSLQGTIMPDGSNHPY